MNARVDVNARVSQALRQGGGVVAVRDRPDLARPLAHLRERGELCSVLPGVFAPAGASSNWPILAQAACRWDPDAVVVGDAAAALSFWPELVPTTVEVGARRVRFVRAGFTFRERRVPPDLVRTQDGLRFAAPALTALDLVERRGTDAIDRALRSRMVTVPALREALDLVPHRRGNKARRNAVIDSVDGPWSAAERLAHRHFRKAGLRGWRANVEVRVRGARYFLDIVFEKERVVVEIDGRVHLSPDLFESDRRRNNDLVLAGWRVLHVTWQMLVNEPERVIADVRRALRHG